MKEKVEKCLNYAIDRLYENDKYLILNRPSNETIEAEKDTRHHVGERSIVFRLAHYLASIIENDAELHEYNLDCEYNRNGVNAKTLPLFPNGTYPDIIVHKRGNNDKNLLVIEVKTYWNSNTTEDKKKIRGFVDPNGEYRFCFGISLVIKQEREDTNLDWISCNDGRTTSDLWG